MDASREKLRRELYNTCSIYCWDGQQNVQILDLDKVAAFIIQDRRRIVDPLVKLEKGDYGYFCATESELNKAIDETLKLISGE